MKTEEKRNLEGIIVVNKPQNWTSHDCVAVVRRVTGIKRVGHTGTLDPMATGVLPVCIGPAARIMEYLELDYKTYRCGMKLGTVTDTDDIWGTVIHTDDSWKNIDDNNKRDVVKSFVGEIVQIPPKYSAIKVNGKKLYEYARAGKDVEIKPRKIIIRSIEVDKIDGDEIFFTVVCSKGTYVRTICKDIGEKLGCGGTMIYLQRSGTGVFTLEDTVDIDEIKNMTEEQLAEKIYPADYPLIHFGKIVLSPEAARDFVNGKSLKKDKNNRFYISEKVRVKNNVSEVSGGKYKNSGRYIRRDKYDKKCEIQKKSSYREMYNVYIDNEFLGVAKIENGFLKAHKIFNVRMQNENI